MLRRGRRSRDLGLIDPKLINPSNIFPDEILYGWVDVRFDVTLNGSDVSSILDQYNANDYVQGTASQQPVYAASGLSGLPEIQDHLANNELLLDASAVSLADASRPSAMLVCNINSYATTRGVFQWYNSGDTTITVGFQAKNTGIWRGWADLTDGTNKTTDCATGSDTTPHLYEYHFDATEYQGWQDGAKFEGSAYNGTTTAALDAVVLGGNVGNGSLDMDWSHQVLLKAQPTGGPTGAMMKTYRRYCKATWPELGIAV